MRRSSRTGALAALAAVLVVIASGCAVPATEEADDSEQISQEEIDAAMQEETTLTLWTWLPGAEAIAEEFEKAYPAITIKIENPSGGAGQDALLRTAIEAGSGIPDLSQFSSTIAPFALTEDLLDLGPYGAEALEDKFVPSTWPNGVVDGKVYGIPTDTGPVAMYYRTDLLESAGIEPPTTWDEFADAAEAYKESTGKYLTNFNQLEYLFLGRQVAPSMVEWDGGEEIAINIDDPAALEWASYWDDLIERDLVSTDPELVDNWYQGIANGKYASWLVAAWGQAFLQGTAAGTAGNWAVAPLPQFDVSEPVELNAGGSFTGVLKYTEHPIQAAVFAKWLGAEPAATQLLTELNVFPATYAQLEDPAFIDQENPFFGGQKVNQLFADVSTTAVSNDMGPLSSFIPTTSVDTVGAALAEGRSLVEGFTALQAKTVEYAEAQGFVVAD